MRILIGVDDSPHSRAAVDFVKRMPWGSQTKVIVVSVARPVVAAYAEIPMSAAVPFVEMTESVVQAHQEIAAKCEDTLKSASFATEAKVIEGDPRTALVEAARDQRADLVVVGSHGRSGIAKLILGSVASHVVTHAPCSVLVVKAGGEGNGRRV